MVIISQYSKSNLYAVHLKLIQNVLVTQSYLTLCNPMDCSPPGSSVHGILQVRILEWVAMPSSRGSSRPGDQTQVSQLQADSLPSEGKNPLPQGKSKTFTVMYVNCFSIKLRGKETCNKDISNKLLAKNFFCHEFMNP